MGGIDCVQSGIQLAKVYYHIQLIQLVDLMPIDHLSFCRKGKKCVFFFW